uniref:Uncharacterized protein n=1 Tax=Hyaloperonospora arabidopsidis (strain Emoy2) TaxID=559515 RepID=M4B5J4_HYAAE
MVIFQVLLALQKETDDENSRDEFHTRKKDKKHRGGNGQETAQTSVNLTRDNSDQGTSDSDSDEESSSMVAMVKKKTSPGNSWTWMLDCGSTTYVCMERDRFTNLKQSKAQSTV